MMGKSAMQWARLSFAVLIFSLLSFAAGKKTSVPNVQTGEASFFSEGLRGEATASGKPFNPDRYVAAHPHYPIGTIVRVINLENGRSIDVEIIDRGPSQSNRRKGVIIDLSRRAAEKLGFKSDGRARVRTRVLKWGSGEAKGTAAQ